MKDCVFCKIVKGDIPAVNIFEDTQTLAFLDIAPAQLKGGHTLVIPKKHYELFTDVPEEELIALIKTMKKVSKALLKFSEGLNILQNNKKIAGQFVPHAHFHLIPRFSHDGIIVGKWTAHQYHKEEIEKIAKKIKSFL